MTIFSFGEEEGVGPFIAMEYVEGRSLRELKDDVGRLEPPRAAALVAQICRALAVAHDNGIIHRDLKPDNVLVEVEDGRENAKVLDFGVAKSSDAKVKTLEGFVLGTPAYMSPEQARNKPIDARSDIYSAGIILYELVFGERPFDAPTPVALMLNHVQTPLPLEEWREEWPEALREILERACAKKPEDRFDSAREFAEALEELISSNATPVPELGALSTSDVRDMSVPTTPGGMETLDGQPEATLGASSEAPRPRSPGGPQSGRVPDPRRPLVPTPAGESSEEVEEAAEQPTDEADDEPRDAAQMPEPPMPEPGDDRQRDLSTVALLVSGLSLVGVAVLAGLVWMLVSNDKGAAEKSDEIAGVTQSAEEKVGAGSAESVTPPARLETMDATSRASWWARTRVAASHARALGRVESLGARDTSEGEHSGDSDDGQRAEPPPGKNEAAGATQDDSESWLVESPEEKLKRESDINRDIFED